MQGALANPANHTGNLKMKMTSRERIALLSKQQLLDVAIDKQNSRDIRDAALQRWLAIDDEDFAASIDRMQNLIHEAHRRMRSGGDVSPPHTDQSRS